MLTNPYPTLVGPLPFLKGHKLLWIGLRVNYADEEEYLLYYIENSRFDRSFSCDSIALIFFVGTKNCIW